MDKEYKYNNKRYGDDTQLESQGSNGIINYKNIAENIYIIYKETKIHHFLLKFIKSIDGKSSSYKFIKTSKNEWASSYSNPDIVGYFTIEDFQNPGKYYINGRVKSNYGYCCLSKIIENDKVLF